MWTEILCLAVVPVVYYSWWILKWRNPKCNGVLPPGSMGLPLIGETPQLIIPSYSLDLHPFIKKRIQKYGSIFRTSMAGRSIVVSSDPEINSYIFQQEGKSVDLWYMDTISKIFDQDGQDRQLSADFVHKYFRSIVMKQFGVDSIKENLLPQFQGMVEKALHNWSLQDSFEFKHAISDMIFDFTAKRLFGYDPTEKSQEKLGEMVISMFDGLVSFPLNIPGTTFHKCLKEGKKVFSILKKLVVERRKSLENNSSDLLGQALNDMATKSFLTENLIVYILLGLSLAVVESLSSALALTMKFISDHPIVIQQLEAEHQEILEKRGKSSSSVTSDQYKSMTYTFQVINEVLRFGSIVPGLLRKDSKDIQVKGYTILADWTIMVVISALHFNPQIYTDPFAFNPARWKNLDSYTISKNFMPFGGGIRQCAGAEYGKAFMATFLHVLVTKYRWTKIKEGGIARRPVLVFGDGNHIKLGKKHLTN